MEDPFGLLELASKPKETKKSLPKKAYLTVISVLVAFVLVLIGVFIFYNKGPVSADTEAPSGVIKITNLPNEVKTGQSISFNIVFTNKGDNISGGFALVQGKGLNISKTVNQSATIKSGEAGYIRKMNDEEYSKFEEKGDGIRYEIGDLRADESKTLSVSAILETSSSVAADLEIKMYKPKTVTSNCGFLNLRECTQTVGDIQVASTSFRINPVDSGKIKLRAGYNFVSFPYVFTQGSISQFLSSMQTKWAYVFDPTTASYLDLNSSDYASRIKPGAAFWLYDKTGGEYDLPDQRVETNVNETYSIPLAIGWNQVGNPYSKKIILSGTKIVVKEISDTGSELGSAYDLKTAISNNIISDPYFVVYSASGSSAVSTVKALLESSLEPYSGFLIKAEKKVNLILPGKEIITPGDNLVPAERTKIESWISENGLNQYGDPAGTVYAGGSPLYNETTSQTIDRFDYILSRHPDRPWNI
jgi:hypothetical protein